MCDPKAEFEFLDFAPPKHTPAAEKPALEPRTAQAVPRDFCACRNCRKARRTERMEPLSLRDRVWIYGVLAVGLGCYAALAWWAL